MSMVQVADQGGIKHLLRKEVAGEAEVGADAACRWLFGFHGMLIAWLILLLIRLLFLSGKGMYNVDEATVTAALDMHLRSGIVGLHPQNGYLLMLAPLHYIVGLGADYESVVTMTILLSSTIVFVGYFFIRALTNNYLLSWMVGVALFMFAPYVFLCYRAYGDGPGAVFMLLAIFLVLWNAHISRPDSGWNNFRILGAGVACGVAFTCHKLYGIMIAALFALLFLISAYHFVKRRSGVIRSIGIFVFFAGGFWFPIMGIHFLVPLYYRVFQGFEYAEHPAVGDLHYCFDMKTYIGQFIYVAEAAKRVAASSGWSRFDTLRFMVWLTHPVYWAFAVIGIVYCIRRTRARVLLLLVALFILWVLFSTFSPLVFLRFVVGPLLLLVVFSACGWYYSAVLVLHVVQRLWKRPAMVFTYIAAFISGIMLLAPGYNTAKKCSAAHEEVTIFFRKMEVPRNRILVNNHATAYFHLRRYPCPVPESLDEVREKYDYVIVDLVTPEAVHVYKTILSDAVKGAPPAKIVSVPAFELPYYMAELVACSSPSFSVFIKRWNEKAIDGLNREKLYIYEVDALRSADEEASQ